MKDFVGNEVKLGSRVVFMQLKYRSLVIGEVIKCTQQFVQILSPSPYSTTGDLTRSKQRYNQIIVLP